MAKDLSNTQKKEWAKTLYLKENLTQQEIADRVGVARITVNRWIADGKWEEQKVGLTLKSRFPICTDKLLRLIGRLQRSLKANASQVLQKLIYLVSYLLQSERWKLTSALLILLVCRPSLLNSCAL